MNDEQEFLDAIARAYRRNGAPEELRAEVLAATARPIDRRPKRALAAIGGIMFLAITASSAAMWIARPAHGEALSALAVHHHESVLAGRMPLDLVSSDPARAVSWLEDRVAFHLRLPRLDAGDIDLVGARVFDAQGTLAVFLLYEKGAEPIGLAIAPARAGAPRDDRASSEIFRDVQFNFRELDGQHVITWVDAGFEYALVSKLPSQGRESCRVCHAPGSGLSGVDDFHHAR